MCQQYTRRHRKDGLVPYERADMAALSDMSTLDTLIFASSRLQHHEGCNTFGAKTHFMWILCTKHLMYFFQVTNEYSHLSMLPSFVGFYSYKITVSVLQTRTLYVPLDVSHATLNMWFSTLLLFRTIISWLRQNLCDFSHRAFVTWCQNKAMIKSTMCQQ